MYLRINPLKLRLLRLTARHSPLMLSKANRFMYGVTSNSGPFTCLDNISTRIFPFLLNTSTKFSSTLKWKAGVSSLRCVPQRCPAVQQNKLLLFKPDSKWYYSALQQNLPSLSDLTTVSIFSYQPRQRKWWLRSCSVDRAQPHNFRWCTATLQHILHPF